MTDREKALEVYKKVIELADGGATAEQLKWWAAAQVRRIEGRR